MEMPKPGAAHSRLNVLLGEWSGVETLHPSPWDPAGGTATSRTVNRAILDGFAIAQEYEQRRGNTVTFRGHGVFWFDAATSQYAMTWWDTMGGVSTEFRGALAGDVLELQSPMTPSGAFRMTYELAAGRHTFKMERSEDGQSWQPSMHGDYEIAKTKGAKAATPLDSARGALSDSRRAKGTKAATKGTKGTKATKATKAATKGTKAAKASAAKKSGAKKAGAKKAKRRR